MDQRCAPVYQVSSSYLQPFPRYCIWTGIFWGIPHFLDICTIDFPQNLKKGRGQDSAIILKVWTIFIKPFWRNFDFWLWLEPEPVKKVQKSAKKVQKKYKKSTKKSTKKVQKSTKKVQKSTKKVQKSFLKKYKKNLFFTWPYRGHRRNPFSERRRWRFSSTIKSGALSLDEIV